MIRSWPSDREINARALRDRMRRGDTHALRGSLYGILSVAPMLTDGHWKAEVTALLGGSEVAVSVLTLLPICLYFLWVFKTRDKWLLPTLEYWRLGLTKS